ncbi:MAG: hypothetical protein Q9167_002360 [Letrouitia subvulpina]
MDPRHQNQNSPPEDHSLRVSFGFNPAQHDPFNTIFSHETDSTFNPAWDAEAFRTPVDPTSGFDQSAHGWHQNPLQSSNLFSGSNYTVQPGAYDQTYSRNPTSFNYPGFSSTPNALAPQAYDSSLPYNQLPLTEDGQFDFSRPQGFPRAPIQSQTISPQALQNYPNAFPQHPSQPIRQSQTPIIDPALTSRKQSYVFPPPPPITRQGWRSLSSAMPQSKLEGIFSLRDKELFPSSTNSKHLIGFTFVGLDNVEVGTTKATIPKYTRRRSKNEIRRMLLQEKGSGPWSSFREPLLKKLKISAKSSVQRSTSAASRGSSNVESPSSIESSSESEPEGDSDYETASEQEVEPEEPSPLPSTRPADPIKAVEYDTIKAVWAKRRVILSGAVIRTALGEYWNVIKGIRDKWKGELTTLQQATEKKERAKVIEYERRHGHPDIVEKLGENPILLVVFYTFIADRFKESDYTGSLISSIVELMARCVTIDQAILEKTKMDKVLSKLVKRAEAQTKLSAQKVLDSASAVSKQKSLDSKSSQVAEVKDRGLSKPPTDTPKASVEPNPGSKKFQGGGSLGPQPAKKLGTLTTTPTGQGVASTTKLPGSVGKKPNPDAKAATKASAASAPKVKTNHIVAKPSGFFQSLQSASKKPGTSNAALQSAKSKEAKDSNAVNSKPEGTAAVASKPAFSFAATMANLNKAKEEAPAKSEEAKPPETPEERRKRLRKEERRKLRVSFKNDENLVEVRIFEHDPEEEMGHDDSMVRDVGDINSEGRMLKMQRAQEENMRDQDMMDIDDEIEETLGMWRSPSLVDFSVVELDELTRNCATRGGKVDVKSEECAIQEQRELTTLMVIYTSPGDIPATPREPVEQESDDYSPEQAFGSPLVETKAREAQYFTSQNDQYRSFTQPPVTQSQTPDISNLLKLLTTQQHNQPQQPQPQPQPMGSQPVSNGLEAIFAQYSHNSQQTPHTQVPQSAQQQSNSTLDLNAALAAITQNNNSRSAFNAAAPPPAQNFDLNSIMAQIQQSQQNQQAQQMHSYGYANSYQNESDRKRPMEYEDQSNNEYGFNKTKRHKTGGEKKKFYGIPRLPSTKTNKTSIAEAESYLNLARANGLFSYSVPPDRLVTEVHSTDSYQNLLFSLLRFRAVTSNYPTHVTIISHEFKRERFLKLHCCAIRWPVERVTYVGINPPEEVTPARELMEGETLRGRGAWEQDLYGTGITLRQKREKRGWRGGPDEKVIMEGLENDVCGLMRWKGGEGGSEVYAGSLPWGNLSQ